MGHDELSMSNPPDLFCDAFRASPIGIALENLDGHETWDAQRTARGQTTRSMRRSGTSQISATNA